MEKVTMTTLSSDELKNIIQDAVNQAIENLLNQINSKNISSEEKLLTRKECADKLKISLVTLNDWTNKGMITSYTIGGRVLYKDSEINNKLMQNSNR